MGNVFNPEMVVLVRESMSLSQTTFAAKLNLKQATLSRYESGLQEIPEDVIGAIAGISGRPRSFFEWNERSYGTSGTFYRRRKRISARDLRKVQAEVNVFRMQAHRLLQFSEIETRYSFHRLDTDEVGGPSGAA